MDGDNPELATGGGRQGGKAHPAHDPVPPPPEWERIEAFADRRGLTGPEFVRFAALAAMEDGPPGAAADDRLAPLIERTRSVWRRSGTGG